MLKILKDNPLITSLLIVLLYAFWFVVPIFFVDVDPNAKGIAGIDGGLKEALPELITGSVLILFLSTLGWWKNIGFTSIKEGGVKFLLPIIFIILSILYFAWSQDASGKWFWGFDSPLQLVTLLGVMFLLGFVEEGIFRGVLFYGLSTKLAPFLTVFISALVFGLFHFVNLLGGAEFTATIYQVIHAFAMGFLYASLRLKIGAIWPLMIMHGFWDFSLFVLQSTVKTTQDGVSMGAGLSIAIPSLMYGLFVYWRWGKTESNQH